MLVPWPDLSAVGRHEARARKESHAAALKCISDSASASCPGEQRGVAGAELTGPPARPVSVKAPYIS